MNMVVINHWELESFSKIEAVCMKTQYIVPVDYKLLRMWKPASPVKYSSNDAFGSKKRRDGV